MNICRSLREQRDGGSGWIRSDVPSPLPKRQKPKRIAKEKQSETNITFCLKQTKKKCPVSSPAGGPRDALCQESEELDARHHHLPGRPPLRPCDRRDSPNMCVCVCTYDYIYIYIERERDGDRVRKRERERDVIRVCVNKYIYRERDRERERE